MKLPVLLKTLRKLALAAASPRLRDGLLRHGVLAGTEHRQVFSRHLNTVVDVGGNRGQFALAARGGLPQAQIISFEPLPEPAAVYRSVFAGDSQAILYQNAIGPSAELRRMHVSARDDSSSLLQISDIQESHFPGTHAVDSEDVQVAPLSQFLAPGNLVRPALLKLDVQGFEFEALLGCESLLHCFDLIYCECSFVELYTGQKLTAQIIDWLSSRGFELIGVYNLEYDGMGQAIQADFLFRPRTINA